MDDNLTPNIEDITPGSVALTPEVDTPQTMNFFKAIEEIKAGNYVARLSWQPHNDFCLMKADFLHIFRDGEFHIWQINSGDLMGEDWVVVVNNGTHKTK